MSISRDEAIIKYHSTKTCKEIADIVGDTTEDAIRSRKRRMRLQGMLPYDPSSTITGDIVSLINGDETDQPISEQEKLDLQIKQSEANTKKYKEEILRKRLEKEQKEEELSTYRFESSLEALKEAVEPLVFKPQPTKCYIPSVNVDEDEVAVLVLSDLHFGKKNKFYNLEISLQRFNTLIDNAIKVLKRQKQAVNIKKLQILFVGDIIDGENIYPTHAHHVDQHALNQIFLTAPTVVARIAELAEMFEDGVDISCVRGNHGRTTKQNHEDNNYDVFYYHTLRLALSNNPNIRFNIAGWYDVVDVNQVKILVFHGHQIKMTLNLPWYGITTRISRWASTEKIGDFDIAVCGHFHTLSNLSWNSKKVITNGTIVDGDDFALEYIGLESSQTQALFGVHPKRKLTWFYELSPVE